MDLARIVVAPSAPMAPQFTTSSEALFRFQVVSAVLSRVRGGMKLQHAVAEVKAQPHPDFDGTTRTVGKRTVYRWVEAYRERGIAGLEPIQRTPPPETALSADFVGFVVDQKLRDPRPSVPELIRRARVRGILLADRA